MIWYFSQDVSKAIGRDIAPMIGVEKTGGLKSTIILKLMKFILKGVDEVEDHSRIVQKISGHFNRIMLQGFLKHFNEGKNVNFYIPPSLQKNWKLNEEWENKAILTPSIFGNRIAWQKRTDTL